MGYKIGSFNLMNLSYKTLAKSHTRNLKEIANIIRQESFDVIALQEVLSEGKAFTSESDRIKRSILMELGTDWSFEWARVDTGNYNDNRGEGYAFLWNTQRLRLSTTKDLTGTEKVFYPQVYKENCGDMIRYPFYARFTSKGVNGGSNMELRLICIHTYYGDDAKDARATRQSELKTILTQVYPKICDNRYGVTMPTYTVVLGDYNAELSRPWKHVLDRKTPAYLKVDQDDEVVAKQYGDLRIKTVQDQFTTLKGSTNDNASSSTRGYAHDYDHFSYAPTRFDGVSLSYQRVDAVRDYYGDDFELYKTEISDHIPISMTLNLRGI